jgi:hypothetical protein
MNLSGPTYPPPPSARRKRKFLASLAVYAVALAFGLALFSGSLPGLPGHFTTNVRLNGHEYYTDGYFLPFPQLGNNSTPPVSVLFQNVTFWIWTTGWYDPHGSYVHGNGTELNRTTFSFLLGGQANNASRPMLFLAPDGRFGAAWSGGFFLELLVEIPSG